MKKLPSQPEFALKETYQAITLRSGKKVENTASKNKRVVDDDDVVEIEATKGNDEVVASGNNEVQDAKKNKNGDAIAPKDDEPKVYLKTLPFPQRFIRRSLDKKFGKFLNYLKEITITIPFMDSI